MLFYKTAAEISVIKENCQLLSDMFRMLEGQLEPGKSIQTLDNLATQYLKDRGALTVFLNYKDSARSKSKAISFIVHCVPDRSELHEGDMISISCQIFRKGFFGFLSRTFFVGEMKPKEDKFLSNSLEILKSTAKILKEGNRTGDIADHIDAECKVHDLKVLKKQLGYGIGKFRVESPVLTHFVIPRSGELLKRGMVFVVHPVLYFNSRQTNWVDDGWTLNNKFDNRYSHYGYTVAVGHNSGEILSEDFETKKQ